MDAAEIAEYYGVCRNACLRPEVHEIRWDAGDSRWVICTDRGTGFVRGSRPWPTGI
jgi:hypothetical protein